MIVDPLARRADRTPDRTAVVEATSGECLTYAGLDRAVAAAAGGLDVGAGDWVGVLAPTGVLAVRAAFAAWRVGATVVPLHDRLTAAELRERAAVADLDVLVADPNLTGRAHDAVDIPVLAGDLAAERRPDPVEWNPHSTCLLLFSSGTTGAPKGVRLTPANLFFSALGSAFRLGVDPEEQWFDPLSVAHAGGIAPVLRSTLYGTGVVLQAEFEAETAREAMVEHDCTGVSLVPAMLDALLDVGDMPDLRFVLLGGGPIPPELVERCERRGVPVYPTYGATETASQIATATPAEAFEAPGTVGRPLLFTDITVVDGDGDPLPAGEVGELVASGPTVSPGYVGETADGSLADGRFLSGDLGHRDADGRLFVVGRHDDRIVTGGETVDPTEVVDALCEHPAVEDAAVVGLPDEEYGQRVGALVVGEAVDTGTLREHCRERLAGFKIPRTVAVTDELPRTPSGTVDREELRERLEG